MSRELSEIVSSPLDWSITHSLSESGCKGHVLLFAGNPIWRGETVGSYALVLNAIGNFDRLDAAAPEARER